MCAIEGSLSVALVPHIHRQEAYTGQLDESVFRDSMISRYEQWNVSPVNFFMPDKTKYPNFSGAKRHFVHLARGDCLFIPAYYFYHLQGFRHITLNHGDIFFPTEFEEKNSTTMATAKDEMFDSQIATAVSLKFQSNSELLRLFYEAIEMKIIK
jgi:hypothetical protein